MELTTKEKYWSKELDKLRVSIDDMQAKGADKKELWLVNSYMKFIESILRFSNLQIPSSENAEELYPGVFRGKRCVNIKSKIPPYELDKNYINWFVFNGMYAEADVVFVKKSMYDIYDQVTKKITVPDELKDVLNNDTVLLGSIKEVVFDYNEKYYVFLGYKSLFKGYCQYNSNWQYPYIVEG